MMSSELIINCKVTCRLTRMRDNALFLLSGVLWAAMIFSLYRTEFIGSVSLAYVGVVAMVAGTFFLWSSFCKAIFGYSKKWPDRRSGDTCLTMDIVAGYFGMEAEYLRIMQQEKHTSIQHLQGGSVVAVSSHNRLKAPAPPVPKKFNARLRAAA